MRKKISYILICLLSFIVFKGEVNAGSLSIWANKSSVNVGDSVTISVSANNLAGSFNVVSSDSSILSGGASNVWLESNTYTYTFTAKSTGSATVTAKAINVSDTEGAGGESGCVRRLQVFAGLLLRPAGGPPAYALLGVPERA